MPCPPPPTSVHRASAAFAAIAFACLLLPSVQAQLPTVEATHLQPTVVQRGSSFELRLAGSRLEELTHATFTHLPPQPTPATDSEQPFKVTPRVSARRLLDDSPLPATSLDVALGDSASPGLYEVRGVGRFGISNPRRILVSDQPVVQPPAGITDPGNAFALPLNTLIASDCTPQQRNYYNLRLAAGQTLRCVAYAQPLDSRASLVLTLLDADQQQLAHSRSVKNWPAEFTFQAKQDVELFLLVHDSLYQGGREYSYALEVAVDASATDTDNAIARPLELNTLLRPSTRRSSAESTTTPTTTSKEPQAPDFSIEASLAKGEYAVDFHAMGTEPMTISVDSQASGNLTDPTLVLYRVDGSADSNEVQLSQLTQQDDAPAIGRPDVRLRRMDPDLLWTPPSAGLYRVRVFDQQAGNRPLDAMQFRLSVATAKPSLSLVAYRPFPTNNPAGARAIGSNLLRGGTESLHVLIIRHGGFQGSVKLQLKGLPDGVRSPMCYVPAAAQEAELILIADENAAAWHGPVQVVGDAQLNEEKLSATVEYAEIQWAAVATRNAVQHRQSPDLWVCCNAADLAPLQVRLGTQPTPAAETADAPATNAVVQFQEPPIAEVARGAKLSLPVAVIRRSGGQAECTLRPQQLAAGVALGEIKIAADKSDAIAELSVNADAPLGEFTFWMQVETKVKFRPNPQALEREEVYLANLKAAVETATEDAERMRLNSALEATNARVEELKKQTAEQEFTVWLPSTPQTVRILPAAN